MSGIPGTRIPCALQEDRTRNHIGKALLCGICLKDLDQLRERSLPTDEPIAVDGQGVTTSDDRHHLRKSEQGEQLNQKDANCVLRSGCAERQRRLVPRKRTFLSFFSNSLSSSSSRLPFRMSSDCFPSKNGNVRTEITEPTTGDTALRISSVSASTARTVTSLRPCIFRF